MRASVLLIVGALVGGCALPPAEEPAMAPAHPVANGWRPDVLTRWIQGDSIGEIAASLGVAPDDVRWMLIGSVRYARSRIGYDRVVAAP